MQGLKASQLKALERLSRRRFPDGHVFSPEQAREIAMLSRAISRQIGLFIDRAGRVRMVLAGTASSIYIPELPSLGGSRLRGWRFLHTHLGEGQLTREDLMDLLFLRLDCAISLSTTAMGDPLSWQAAWIAPPEPPQSLLAIAGVEAKHSCLLAPPRAWHDTACDLTALARDIEDCLGVGDLARSNEETALLVSVSPDPLPTQERNLAELAALARSAGLNVGGYLTQRVTRPDPRLLLGKGKLMELEVQALNAAAGMLVFDGELSPAQLRSIADATERKVIDRTQLILDIFAQHASTRAGKLQVELAQLAYALPRLTGQRKALDRLAGGIGGRGPGETALETDRRKSRERMARLRHELERLRRQRALGRKNRERNSIPVAALVGYTNAGKASLLNRLTASSTLVRDQLFATLDPVTRRLRFPKEREVTLADTVGFIRNLPKDLLEAFSATLEELGRADALIHVADAADDDLERHIGAVEGILEDLELGDIPRILVLNKCDLIDEDERARLLAAFPGAVALSAQGGFGLEDLLLRLERELFIKNLQSKLEAEDEL